MSMAPTLAASCAALPSEGFRSPWGGPVVVTGHFNKDRCND
jgi:hypothetical protein